jgi:hypothetical protein
MILIKKLSFSNYFIFGHILTIKHNQMLDEIDRRISHEIMALKSYFLKISFYEVLNDN